MVIYKLGIFNKKEGRVIELDNEKGLENLDIETLKYNSEDELKLYLYNKELISKEEIKYSLSIMYKNKGKINKLPVLYKDMTKYLDIVQLRYELKSLSNDIVFLEKLARHYSIGSGKFNPQGLNVSDIRRYIGDVRTNGGHNFYSRMLEEAINDLYKKAIFKEINKENGEVKFNYRGLRDLGLFIYKYKNKLENKIEKEEKNTKEEWIQATMFDSIDLNEENDNKWHLSSEGESEFPPNSEEEKNYLRYLEELEEMGLAENIENHDHYRR